MQALIFPWLSREFVFLSGEARAVGPVAEQTSDLFRRFGEELKLLGLSLDNCVRTRLWGADREARDLGTAARSNVLTGARKAASSSYVSATHFDSAAKVALDLLAMRTSHPGSERQPVEFEPPRNYLRHLRYDSVVFVSGLTSEASRLEDQVPEVLAALDDTLGAASTRWAQVVKLSVYLSRTQKVDVVTRLLVKANRLELSKIEFEFVDGFAREKSLLEVEATALAAG
jgi:enamine deaminase RidA (YjgF/YER057c/UK114 family)